METETEMGFTTVLIHTFMLKPLERMEHILVTLRQLEPEISPAVQKGWESTIGNKCKGLGSRMKMVGMGDGVDSGARFVVGHELNMFHLQAYRIRLLE